jgi:hypothetical protein
MQLLISLISEGDLVLSNAWLLLAFLFLLHLLSAINLAESEIMRVLLHHLISHLNL